MLCRMEQPQAFGNFERPPLRSQSQFESETSIWAVGPNTWGGNLSEEWNINTNPNGGYALSLLMRAMQSDLSQHPDPVSTNCHFLRPCLGGEPAEMRVEVIRTGRRTSTVRGELHQDGKPRLVSLATLANLDHWESESGLATPVTAEVSDLSAPAMPGPHQCPKREGSLQGVSLPLMSRVDVRLDPKYSNPGESDRAIMQGWIRLADGGATTVDCLPLFADCFPPSMFSLLGQTGWVPTVELTVHVRRRPSPGWIQARFETAEVGQGLCIEDGILWDEEGTLVAQSRQLALVIGNS